MEDNKTLPSVSASAEGGASPSTAGNQNANQQPKEKPSVFFNYADDYVKNRFLNEINEFAMFKGRKTGFPNVDDNQFFYPGLYSVAGISSIGKTSWCQQLAVQLAEGGSHVLYFSLEQSSLELTAKNIARYINQQSKRDPSYSRFNALQIRLGNAITSREFAEQLQAYTNNVQNRLCIVQCNMSITVEQIITYVSEFMKAYPGIIPVVFIDYLQIISPSELGGRVLVDAKTNVDHIVHELKAFQMSKNLTIVVICSLNRASYQTSMNMQALKESGSIEFTSDWVGGLQLQLLEKEEYRYIEDPVTHKRRATTDEEKDQMINDEKSEPIRRIELVVLKNRGGKPYYKAYFNYEPEFDTFTACDEKGNPYVSTTQFMPIEDEDPDNPFA